MLPDDIDAIISDIEDMLADDGSRMMKILFAAYYEEFHDLWGDDPLDFLFRLCVRKLESPDGKVAYAWGFIDEFVDDVDRGGDDDGEDEGLLWPGGQRGGGGAGETGVPPSIGGHRAG